jgi:hypothetical protein
MPHVVWFYAGISFVALVVLAATVKSPDATGAVKSPDATGTIKSPDFAATVRG